MLADPRRGFCDLRPSGRSAARSARQLLVATAASTAARVYDARDGRGARLRRPGGAVTAATSRRRPLPAHDGQAGRRHRVSATAAAAPRAEGHVVATAAWSTVGKLLVTASTDGTTGSACRRASGSSVTELGDEVDFSRDGSPWCLPASIGPRGCGTSPPDVRWALTRRPRGLRGRHRRRDPSHDRATRTTRRNAEDSTRSFSPSSGCSRRVPSSVGCRRLRLDGRCGRREACCRPVVSPRRVPSSVLRTGPSRTVAVNAEGRSSRSHRVVGSRLTRRGSGTRIGVVGSRRVRWRSRSLRTVAGSPSARRTARSASGRPTAGGCDRSSAGGPHVRDLRSPTGGGRVARSVRRRHGARLALRTGAGSPHRHDRRDRGGFTRRPLRDREPRPRRPHLGAATGSPLSCSGHSVGRDGRVQPGRALDRHRRAHDGRALGPSRGASFLCAADGTHRRGFDGRWRSTAGLDGDPSSPAPATGRGSARTGVTRDDL